MNEEKASATPVAEGPPNAADAIPAEAVAGHDLPAEMLDSTVPYDFDTPGGCG